MLRSRRMAAPGNAAVTSAPTVKVGSGPFRDITCNTGASAPDTQTAGAFGASRSFEDLQLLFRADLPWGSVGRRKLGNCRRGLTRPLLEHL